MLGCDVPGLDGVRHRLVDFFALEVIVDLGVAEAEVGFVGLAGDVVEKVRGGGLEVQALGCLEVLEQ